MSERVLRGSRLGSVSYETDRDTDLAPRQMVAYACPRGHQFTVPFASEADVPSTWQCTECSSIALLLDGTPPEEKAGKPAWTHWDMLLERRSIDDLEVLLAERLDLLRGTEPGGRKTA